MAPRAYQQATHQVYSCAGYPSARRSSDWFLEPACKLSQTCCASSICRGDKFIFCAGFTAVDVLGHGTMGHVIGTGAILSLRVSNSIVACLLAVFEQLYQDTNICLYPAGPWQDLSCAH